MLIDPEGVLALLHEQRESDLALVAIVAGMANSEQEAIDRLALIEQAHREYRDTLNRSRDHLAYAISSRAIEIAPRLATAIQQVEKAGLSEKRGNRSG
jgi:hypothetical protein